MKKIVAKLPLHDSTKGIRFDVMGIKGLYRQRKILSRGFKIEAQGETFVQIHMGKKTLYVEKLNPLRTLHNWALRGYMLNLAQYAKQFGA